MNLNTYFAIAFDKTLKNFEVSGKQLSEESGVSQNHISGFRKGDNITLNALSKMMEALNRIKPGSLLFFLEQILEIIRNNSSNEVITNSSSNEVIRSSFFKRVEIMDKYQAIIQDVPDEELDFLILTIANQIRVRQNNSGNGTIKSKIRA